MLGDAIIKEPPSPVGMESYAVYHGCIWKVNRMRHQTPESRHQRADPDKKQKRVWRLALKVRLRYWL